MRIQVTDHKKRSLKAITCKLEVPFNYIFNKVIRVNGRIILKWFMRKDWKLVNQFDNLRIGSSTRLL
jgi:hypothetical protein